MALAIVLRRDFALWACAFVFTDLVSADDMIAGAVGKLGLAAGTLATLLLVPLVVTSNRLSMRLGKHWSQLHFLRVDRGAPVLRGDCAPADPAEQPARLVGLRWLSWTVWWWQVHRHSQAALGARFR